HLVHAVVEASFETKLVVERRVDRDGHAVLARDRPAAQPDPLDEHLVGLEYVPVDAEPAPLDLLEVSGRETLADVAQGGPGLGAGTGGVGLAGGPGRLALAELALLAPQLVGDLVGVARHGARRSGDDQPAQRLAQLQRRRGARLPAELDDAANLCD